MKSFDHPYVEFGKLSIDEIAELIPGWLHINSTKDFGLLYMSPRMEKDMQISTEEIKKIGAQYLRNHIHPETTERVIPQLSDFVKNIDFDKTLSFYQYIEIPGKGFLWFLSTVRFYTEETLIVITVPVSVLKEFNGRIKEILNENIYLRSNLKIYQRLTKRERELIKLFSAGLTNQEVADQLHISKLTVKTHRNNIYRKLNISNLSQLMHFAHTSGLS